MFSVSSFNARNVCMMIVYTYACLEMYTRSHTCPAQRHLCTHTYAHTHTHTLSPIMIKLNQAVVHNPPNILIDNLILQYKALIQ